MTNEERIISNHIVQLKIIQEAINNVDNAVNIVNNAIDNAVDNALKENKEYKARCRKCGEPINLDMGEEGRCQWCV